MPGRPRATGGERLDLCQYTPEAGITCIWVLAHAAAAQARSLVPQGPRQAWLATQVEVMHAFIDQEHFPGVTLDIALRALLQRFRLPGAQCSACIGGRC